MNYYLGELNSEINYFYYSKGKKKFFCFKKYKLIFYVFIDN